jgi:hypothetical protein
LPPAQSPDRDSQARKAYSKSPLNASDPKSTLQYPQHRHHPYPQPPYIFTRQQPHHHPHTYHNKEAHGASYSNPHRTPHADTIVHTKQQEEYSHGYRQIGHDNDKEAGIAQSYRTAIGAMDGVDGPMAMMMSMSKKQLLEKVSYFFRWILTKN